MIVFNNKQYKTLDQKLYFGNQQVKAAYWGGIKVYPEKSKNIIDGHELKGVLLNGYVYDTGIAPTKGTSVEICFENNQNTIGNVGFPVFGTHHDVYNATGGVNRKYNPCADFYESDSKRDASFGGDITAATIDNNGNVYYNYLGDWGKGNSHTNCFNWLSNTSFHFIIKKDYLYARYGGVSVAGNTPDWSPEFNNYTSNGLTAQYVNNSQWNYNSSSDDNILQVDTNYWNQSIEKTDESTNESINGKFFTFKIERQQLVSGIQLYSEQPNLYNLNLGKIHVGQGIGSLYHGNDRLYQPFKLTKHNSNKNNNPATKQKAPNENYVYTKLNYHQNKYFENKYMDYCFSTEKNEGYDVKGGNLWIGTNNRNFSSTGQAVSPNKIRKNLPVSILQNLTKSDFSTDCNDLHRELFKTGKLAWVYIIIEDVKDDGTYRVIDGKPVKYMFLPEETNIKDNDNNNYVIFKRYNWDLLENKWSSEPDRIILPFMKCNIYNT